MNDQLVTEISRRAMATEFGVALPGENRAAIEAAIDALEELESIEAALSVYRPESDISRINRSAGSEPVKVGPHTLAVLQRAIAIHRLTAGAFDVTAGPLVACWGFTRRRGKKPTDQEIQDALALVGSEALAIDPVQQTVMLTRHGMAINLGGIGKGYALDHISRRLQACGLNDFLLHGGRSSILARGSDSDDPLAGWKVAIEHPLRPGIRLAAMRLRDAALATSGSGKQFFHHRGQRFGHVLDPRIGRPAGDMLAISVVTSTAMDADALATACFVEGLAAIGEQLQRPLTARKISDPQPRQEQTAAEQAAAPEPPSWPTAAVAIVAGRRQGEVRLEPLGDTAGIGYEPL